MEFLKQCLTEKQKDYLWSGRYERVDCIWLLSAEPPSQKNPYNFLKWNEFITQRQFSYWLQHDKKQSFVITVD